MRAKHFIFVPIVILLILLVSCGEIVTEESQQQTLETPDSQEETQEPSEPEAPVQRTVTTPTQTRERIPTEPASIVRHLRINLRSP